MSFRRRSQGKGKELENACDQILLYRRVPFYYRNSVGAMQTDHGFYRFGVPGAPDFVCVIRGIYIGIECKMGTGKQTDHQKAFQEKLEAAGGQYWLVRTPDDLQAKLDAFMVL